MSKFKTASQLLSGIPQGSQLISVKLRRSRAGGYEIVQLASLLTNAEVMERLPESRSLMGCAAIIRHDDEEIVYVDHETGPEMIVVGGVAAGCTLMQFLTGKSLPQLILLLWKLGSKGYNWCLEIRSLSKQGKLVERQLDPSELTWLDKLEQRFRKELGLLFRRLSADDSVKVSKRRQRAAATSGRTVGERNMATYEHIQAWVKGKHGFVPETCWIAHVKELCGLSVRRAANRRGKQRVHPCPEGKRRAAIKSAFRHFGMV